MIKLPALGQLYVYLSNQYQIKQILSIIGN